MKKKIMSVFICLFLIGIIPAAAGMNDYEDKIGGESSNQVKIDNTITKDVIISWGHIDREGYLIFNVINRVEYDIYNISFDIEFVGGVLFFKVNSKTDAFVDYLPSGETVEVKSNDSIIKPKPIIGRPLFLGQYFLTIDEYRCILLCLFIPLFVIQPIMESNSV